MEEAAKYMAYYLSCLRLSCLGHQVSKNPFPMWFPFRVSQKKEFVEDLKGESLTEDTLLKKVVMARHSHEWTQSHLACCLFVQLVFSTVGPADDSSPRHHEALSGRPTDSDFHSLLPKLPLLVPPLLLHVLCFSDSPASSDMSTLTTDLSILITDSNRLLSD